jgi:glucan-binding YG repeat protein
MFLGQLDKPDVDFIEGLSPAISIDQKTTSKNPRSTVGTVTEIYDYLRLLYARIGIPHCPVCGKEIRQQSTDQILDRIMALPEGTRFIVLSPVVRGQKGTQEKVLADARRSGFVRVMIDGNTYAPNQEDIEYSASKGEVFIDKDEAWFLFDEEGKFQSSVTGIIDNRYVLNGQIVWHPGVVEYNGEYYYFRGDKENGNKLAEGDTWVTRNNTDADFVLGGCYNFVNGKLSGINGVVEGKYYENSKLMTSKGLVKLEGGYIYVRSNGEVVVNRDYWITKTNGYSIVNVVYTFDKDGYIVDPIDPTVYDGIVEINGVNYYYENGIKQCCKGVVEMTDENGDIFYIYVKSDGSLATGSYWPTNTNNYLKRGAYDWGTDGRYYPAD